MKQFLVKYLGFGALIWGVAFVVASALIGFKVQDTWVMQVATSGAVLIAAFLLAKNLNLASRKEMLKYSLSWAATGVLLDALITVQFTGWQFFYTWEMWLGYLLVVLVPFLAVKSSQ